MFAGQESILYEVSGRVGLLFEIFPKCNSVLKVKVLVTSLRIYWMQMLTNHKESEIKSQSATFATSKRWINHFQTRQKIQGGTPFFVNIFSSKFPDGSPRIYNKKNIDGIRKRLKVIVSHEKRLIKEREINNGLISSIIIFSYLSLLPTLRSDGHRSTHHPLGPPPHLYILLLSFSL